MLTGDRVGLVEKPTSAPQEPMLIGTPVLGPSLLPGRPHGAADLDISGEMVQAFVLNHRQSRGGRRFEPRRGPVPASASAGHLAEKVCTG